MFPYQERNRNSFSLSASLMVENACFIIKCPFLLLASRPFFLPVLFSPPGNCLLWMDDRNQTKLGQDQKLKCIRNCATYTLMFWFTANIKFSSCNLIKKLDVWDAYSCLFYSNLHYDQATVNQQVCDRSQAKVSQKHNEHSLMHNWFSFLHAKQEMEQQSQDTRI